MNIWSDLDLAPVVSNLIPCARGSVVFDTEEVRELICVEALGFSEESLSQE